MSPDPSQPVDVRWMTAFVDVPASGHAAGGRFWCGVTGSRLSEARGASRQFATFLPADGDAYLRLQRIADGPPGVHLDLHVEDLDQAAARAVSLGAQGGASDDGVRVMRSPGGLAFCFVGHHGERVSPTALRSPGGRRSLVDQVCIDITPKRYAVELAFWTALTGWPSRPTDSREFQRIEPPAEQPLTLLLQRLEDPADGPTRAHLDLACDSVAGETARHRELGARVVAVHADWTTMADPAGRAYCLTRRRPGA
jgi:hypothetical protein